MVTGGAIGTLINGIMINYYEIAKIYLVSSMLFFIVGLVAQAKIKKVKPIQKEALVESIQ
jgi:hypothetical protein